MSTRRFQDDMADSTPSEPADDERPARSARPTEAERQAVRSGGASRRNASHMPRTLSQVMNEANDQVIRGDLSDYVPLPTGFDPLDGLIGGGLRKTELILLGGAQGIG